MNWKALVLAAGLALAAPVAVAAGLDDVEQANRLYSEGRYELAIEAYTRAIVSGELDPSALAIVYNNRGVAYNAIGDYDHAIADYQEALSLQPGDPTTLRNLRIALTRRAVAAANAGKYEEALADLGKAIELEPSHPLAWLRRAEVYMELGQLDRARRDLEEARRRGADAQELASASRRLELLEEAARRALLAPPPPPPAELAASAQARAGTGPEEPAPSARPAGPAATAGSAVGPASGEAPAAGDAGTASTTRQAAEGGSQPAPSATARPGEAATTRYRAIVDVNARKGPGNDHEVVRIARKGQVLEVLGEVRGWKHVRFEDGLEAYIYRRWLEPVEPEAEGAGRAADGREG